MNFDIGSFCVVLSLLALMLVDCKMYKDCLDRIKEFEEKYKK